MIFDCNCIERLRNDISLRLSSKRFKHSLGVEDTAAKIGSLCLPDKICKLRCAALLHDVAKEYDKDTLLLFIQKDNFPIKNEDKESPQILHSFAAPYIIKKEFNEFAKEEILSACMKHTTGDGEMTIFDEIIFISDFIEDGRTYDACREVRELFFSSASSEKSVKENIFALHKAVLECINKTVSNLTENGKTVNKRTLAARKLITELLNAKEK